MAAECPIVPFRITADDYEETQELKSRFARLRTERQPLHLTSEEFDQILRWKLRGQYGRQIARRAANTDSVIRAITGLALTITHPAEEYQTELRLGILRSLRGVDVPVASAILTLVFPDEYAVIDFRGWRQVFGGEHTQSFSISEYKSYLSAIRWCAGRLHWSTQEVDLAIWERDRRSGSQLELTHPPLSACQANCPSQARGER